MIPFYFVALSLALFGIGISGMAASRHFLIMMLSIEVAIISSTILAVAFFYYLPPGNVLLVLLSIWSVASTEVIALVAIYRYLTKEEVSLDISKLSKLKN